jgi:hypothetical protein
MLYSIYNKSLKPSPSNQGASSLADALESNTALTRLGLEGHALSEVGLLACAWSLSRRDLVRDHLEVEGLGLWRVGEQVGLPGCTCAWSNAEILHSLWIRGGSRRRKVAGGGRESGKQVARQWVEDKVDPEKMALKHKVEVCQEKLAVQEQVMAGLVAVKREKIEVSLYVSVWLLVSGCVHARLLVRVSFRHGASRRVFPACFRVSLRA